ncbi:RsfA family transcriptional regulator [Lederbergia sp. NSJ-179]|uniref:RsfA family transcriptional regulator n=1 Tax=Lederbergia sp. NSJ-179 TaxID=2931402 RepID=UPI002455E2BB|nr:RsfA family transcriptional regulator [Lederbergia sp. NSJ-179]
MSISRQDAWSSDEDNLLAELVLSHIREASTQLKAFEEAGKQLKRTAAACGFRWNSNIRKQYKEEIEQAKKARKQRKEGRLSSTEENAPERAKNQFKQEAPSTILADATFLFEKLEKELSELEQFKLENKELKERVEILKAESLAAKEEVEETNRKYQELKKDYHSLMYLLDKARKMAGEFSIEINETNGVKVK